MEVLPVRGNNQLRQECSEGSFGGVNLALTMPRAAQASITPSCYPALPGPVAAPEQLASATVLHGTEPDRQRRFTGRFRRTFVDPLAQPPFSGRGRAWPPKTEPCRPQDDDDGYRQ